MPFLIAWLIEQDVHYTANRHRPQQASVMRTHLVSLFLSAIMSSTVADPERLRLEATSAKWFRGVWISGIVVAVGCMFELWEVVFDLRNWRRHRKDKSLLFDNPGSWRYPLAALGLFLVVGGIVSETVFEVLDATSESELRSNESDKLTDAETEANSATGRAAKLEKEAACLQKKAEDERLARMRLEAEIQPREYTPSQKDAIVAACKPFKGVVLIRSMPFDVEGAVFAESIARLLHDRTQLQVRPNIGNNFMNNLPMFVGVVVRGPEAEQPLVTALRESLSTNRVVVDPTAPFTQPDSPVQILVGAKPLKVP